MFSRIKETYREIMGVEEKKALPPFRFCPVCGKELVLTEWPTGYNPYTGKQLTAIVKKCPDGHYLPNSEGGNNGRW